jgi:hypothetical protein
VKLTHAHLSVPLSAPRRTRHMPPLPAHLCCAWALVEPPDNKCIVPIPPWTPLAFSLFFLPPKQGSSSSCHYRLYRIIAAPLRLCPDQDPKPVCTTPVLLPCLTSSPETSGACRDSILSHRLMNSATNSILSIHHRPISRLISSSSIRSPTLPQTSLPLYFSVLMTRRVQHHTTIRRYHEFTVDSLSLATSTPTSSTSGFRRLWWSSPDKLMSSVPPPPHVHRHRTITSATAHHQPSSVRVGVRCPPHRASPSSPLSPVLSPVLCSRHHVVYSVAQSDWLIHFPVNLNHRLNHRNLSKLSKFIEICTNLQKI